MNGGAALKLINREGVYGLCGPDGCPCLNFEVHGVQVEISCRKSGAAMEKINPDFYGIKVRVHSRHMDAHGADLHAIAQAVAGQMRDEGYAIMVRFCEHRHDAECLCIYCEKPREKPAAYLCRKCEGNPDTSRYRDYQKFDFTLPAAEE